MGCSILKVVYRDLNNVDMIYIIVRSKLKILEK